MPRGLGGGASDDSHLGGRVSSRRCASWRSATTRAASARRAAMLRLGVRYAAKRRASARRRTNSKRDAERIRTTAGASVPVRQSTTRSSAGPSIGNGKPRVWQTRRSVEWYGERTLPVSRLRRVSGCVPHIAASWSRVSPSSSRRGRTTSRPQSVRSGDLVLVMYSSRDCPPPGLLLPRPKTRRPARRSMPSAQTASLRSTDQLSSPRRHRAIE